MLIVAVDKKAGYVKGGRIGQVIADQSHRVVKRDEILFSLLAPVVEGPAGGRVFAADALRSVRQAGVVSGDNVGKD